MSLPQASHWAGRHGPLLIAEIGGNHEGDFDAALRMADLAIGSGADVVKFQIYTGDTLVSPVESPDRHRHFQRFELAPEQHIALARHCRAAGRDYNASVWDLDALDWLDPYLTFYKIGSGDLTAYPLLEGFARRGKPILLSTGLSDLEEVADAVRLIRRVNPAYASPGMLALLQCTSMYPTSPDEVNLLAMDALASVALAVVGGAYLALEPERYRRGFVKLFPKALTQEVEEVLATLGRALQRWLLATLLAMACVGVAAGLAAWAIGLPAPLARLMAGLMELAPGEPLMSRDNLDSMRLPNVAGGELPGFAPELGVAQPYGLDAIAPDYLAGRDPQTRYDQLRATAGR